jgi:transcriptional regulator with XRE-family HTH domain
VEQKMSVNERIREVRNNLKLSQAKFAERMAISSSYLADIELSKRTATERIVRLLSAEFNVDEHWLRTGEGGMFKSDVDVQVASILSLFKSLSPQFKECAISQLRELADLHGSFSLNRQRG